MKYDQDLEADPEQQLRKRVLQQAAGEPTTAPADVPAAADTPVPAAPFDAQEKADPTPQQPPAPVTPTPPAPAFSGGAPPLPHDPYYQAWLDAHPNPNAAPAVGPQVNFDNSPRPGAPTGPTNPASRTDAGQIRAKVQQWMQANNPQGHKDADYWIKRITETGGLGSDNEQYWLGRFTEAPGTHQEGGGAPVSSGQPLPRSTVGGISAPQGLWGPDFVSQLRQILMQRLQAAGQPVDPNAPQIHEPLVAARDEATRQTDKERTQLAERLYAQGGLNTDAITQQIQQSGERNATQLGTLRATLIQKEVQSRKDELRDLLQMAFASGDSEATREIQLQLAELDALLRREGYGVQLALSETNANSNAF